MTSPKLAEFKRVIDFLCDAHANATIDFVYPVKHGDKRRSKLGEMTSYSVLLGSSGPIVRIVIDWSRLEDGT